VRMLVAVSLLVPLLDQAVKLLLRRRLGSQAVRLGVLGSVRVVNGSLWIGSLDTSSRMVFVWIVWSLSTVALVVVSHFIPSSHLFVGLLLGGSLSHGLEQSVRGRISDYICLRFWPAFNLADVALTVGAIGVTVRAIVVFVR
jgi:signal peptidase II